MILIVADTGPVNYLIQIDCIGVLAQLAEKTVLLMDDRQARACAAALGVVTMGTVGLLEVAAARDLVSLPDALERLRKTSCFLADDLIADALDRDAARRRA